MESVSPHLVNGESAYSYVVTLAPQSDGAVTFRLLTNQACSSGGICAADGTLLSQVPAALVIGPLVTVSFAQASYNVSEGSARSIQIRLSAAYQGVRSLEIPVSLGTGATASSDDFTYTESVTFAAGETTKLLTVRGLDDTLVEGDESVTLEFGRLPDGVSEGTQASTTVVINDTDQANIDFYGRAGPGRRGRKHADLLHDHKWRDLSGQPADQPEPGRNRHAQRRLRAGGRSHAFYRGGFSGRVLLRH